MCMITYKMIMKTFGHRYFDKKILIMEGARMVR